MGRAGEEHDRVVFRLQRQDGCSPIREYVRSDVHKYTILIVADESAARRVIALLLEEAGYATIWEGCTEKEQNALKTLQKLMYKRRCGETSVVGGVDALNLPEATEAAVRPSTFSVYGNSSEMLYKVCRLISLWLLFANRRLLLYLILLDLVMLGMGGLELLRTLKSDGRTLSIPTIIITGMSGDEARISALQGGAADYLIKPFDKTELRTRLG